MKEYLKIIRHVLDEGVLEKGRTIERTYRVPGVIFKHDMSKGFPLLTTKRMPYKLISSELEFFIKGMTDKKWLQDQENHIWDEWCNPEIVPYGQDEKTKRRMVEERDLGPVYGFQWRNFGAKYDGYEKDYSPHGVDQIANAIRRIKKNPTDRRIIVSAWNPLDESKMALPPCHWGFQVVVINNKLSLMWNQRSVDVMLGLPFNIASYATFLHLLAKETGREEGTLTGFLGDTHIYEHHLEGARLQLTREPLPLPRLETKNFSSIFDWKYQDTSVVDYKHHDHIKFEIAV